MGLVSEKPFATFPNGFQTEIVEKFINETNCGGILANRPASGTAIIEEWNGEHHKTGFPIVYTSADSVFQIAVDTDFIPLETLYKWCETAREILNDYNVSRVIARPYKIIDGKGATFYGIAGALTQICRAINNNEYAILTVSSHHDDIEGVKGVSLSLPTVINKKGVFHVISPKLSDDERAKLKSSAEIMKEYTDKALAMIEENK